MLKKYYNSSEERILKEKSSTMFSEISSGVYQVIKDREDLYPEFISSERVVDALNINYKVSVTSKSGIYANFDLSEY